MLAFDTAVALAKSSKSSAVTLNMKNKDNITLEVLQKLSQMSKENAVATTLNFEFTDSSGSVVTRLNIDPSKATKSIEATACFDNTVVLSVKNIYNTYFKNKIAILKLGYVGALEPGQTRDIGTPVNVATKLPLTNMDTTKLKFYVHDPITNSSQAIITNYHIDNEGFLHFSTDKSGYVIISEGSLERK